VTKGLQPLAGSCESIRKADVADMPKELQTILSEDVDDYEIFGFPHGCPGFVPQRFRLPPCFDDDEDDDTDNLEESPPSFSPESTFSPAVQEPIDEDGTEAVLLKTAGKWQKCNLVSGMASVASNMGWL